MGSSDINFLLEPVSAEAPCGIDLEGSAIADLDRLAMGRAEQQMGSTVVPAEPPDWKQVQATALQILGKSKDLRAASHLTKAWLRTEGWPGLARGLLVLGGFIERYWEGLFPLLDPDDDNDPTMRVNILMGLADPTILAAIRATPLLTSRTLGRFALKDVEAAASEGASSEANGGGGAPSMASIEGAAMDCDLDVLRQSAADVRSCVTGLVALESALAAQVESGRLPSFASLSAPVIKADAFMRGVVARRVPAAATGAAPDAGLATTVASGAGGGGWTGGIRSREDVVKALDAICAYYDKNEPSSPLPIFMARCKRLVMMGFVDIVRELVPDALSQIDVLRGRVEEQ